MSTRPEDALYEMRQTALGGLSAMHYSLCRNGNVLRRVGAKVAHVGQELIDRFEARLADYQRLQAECRFDEANLVLGQLMSNKHSILAKRVAQVRRLAEDSQAYRQEQMVRCKLPARRPRLPWRPTTTTGCERRAPEAIRS